MTSFHNYLLNNHSGFDQLAGVETTRATTYQVPYYRQYVTVLCQNHIFLLQGCDMRNFLQGQLCGDIRELSPEQSLWTAHCTPKGRVFSTLLLLELGNSIAAICPASNATALIERLQKYILFSKLTIQEPEKKPYLLECAGPDTQVALQDFFPQLPETPMATTKTDELTAVRLPGEQARWLLIAANDQIAITVWEKLVKTHSPIGAQAHQQLLVEAGLVEIGAELQEAFLPQMIALDKLGGMSLKKGCYVGQEVIARTSNLGKLKRHLYRAELAGNPAPVTGADITDKNDAVMGTCVSSYYDCDHDRTHILAVIAQRGLDNETQLAGSALQNIVLAYQ